MSREGVVVLELLIVVCVFGVMLSLNPAARPGIAALLFVRFPLVRSPATSAGVTPAEAEKKARSGELLPIYLIVGEERFLADKACAVIRTAATEGGIDGLNDDTFNAPQAKVEEVLTTAKTMPMMATRRFVMARDIDKWESKSAKGAKKSKTKGKVASPLDQLLDYAQTPEPSAIVVFTAEKLDKRKKLYTFAKKAGWLVECERPKRHELPGWIQARAKTKGAKIGFQAADLLAELAGPDIATIEDALERVSLYAGNGKEITEEDISETVVRVRTKSVWELVSAVSARNLGLSLSTLDDVYDPSDRGLSLIGILSWATRQLIKYQDARSAGMSPPEAAKAAGVPPFKSRELEEQVRKMPKASLSRWLQHLAEADLDLKGGSKLPPRAIIRQMLFDLCA